MAGLQSDEGRMMIGAIHQRDRHTDSHVAIVNASALCQAAETLEHTGLGTEPGHKAEPASVLTVTNATVTEIEQNQRRFLPVR